MNSTTTNTRLSAGSVKSDNIQAKSSNLNFYTPNGWEGSRYDPRKRAKEVARELRAYIKANPDLNACKWSIRSTWGMYSDSLYISLMAAPFDPFSAEYKARHEYRYNRGYSEHGTVKDYTSPEAYKLMMKVEAFVMHYIHDDSDSMSDYFDRNIYYHCEIGQSEKPFKQVAPSGGPNEAKASEPVATPEGLEIVDYSEKAIAVFGETKAIKEQLKELGGRFNPSLKYHGEKRTGWIFCKKQADKVRALFEAAQEPAAQKPVVTCEIEARTANLSASLELPAANDTTESPVPSYGASEISPNFTVFQSDLHVETHTGCDNPQNVARTSVFIKVLLSDGTLIEDTRWQSMEDLHIVLSNFCESYYPDHEGFILIESLEPDGSRKIEEIHAITKDYLRDMGLAE